jgi:hypothetical protein
MTEKQLTSEPARARFEYRVWGPHRRARTLLPKLAEQQSSTVLDDWYLLVADSSVNAKIRHNSLKIKQLVAEREGFEQWTSGRHRSAGAIPTPFDVVFERLCLDRLRHGEEVVAAEIESLGAEVGVRPVFVTKDRRRFRIGDLCAETTDIRLHETGETLRTLLIEGDDLSDLIALRKRLGLGRHPNVAVHTALAHRVEVTPHVVGRDSPSRISRQRRRSASTPGRRRRRMAMGLPSPG